MKKDYSSTLRKIIRKKQYKDFDGEIKGKGKVVILEPPEKQIIWTDESILMADDPTLIKSIGGEYIIKNYLKKVPTVYDLQVINHSLQIIGENKLEGICEGIKGLVEEPKSNLNFLPTTPQEFEKSRYNRLGIPSSKEFKDRLDYIQKTFSDKDLKIFHMEGLFLYFFED